MLVKKERKRSKLIYIIPMLTASLYSIRVYSLMKINNTPLKLEYLETSLNRMIDPSFPLILDRQAVMTAFFVAIFVFALINTYLGSYKRTVQEQTYGTSEWGDAMDLNKMKAKNYQDNVIITNTEQFAKDAIISNINRHIFVCGRPGTGKTRAFLYPNILSATGSIVITDPKGEALRALGHSLLSLGYRIKVFNLDKKYESNHYNPFHYIKKIPKVIYHLDDDIAEVTSEKTLAQDDVMSLINLLFKATQSTTIKSSTGDPFWEKAEMIFLQAITYYMLFRLPENEHTFSTMLDLIRKANPDENDKCQLDDIFEKWKAEEPNHVGVKQYEHFKSARGKMLRTIVLTAVARLAPLNIEEVSNLTSYDDLELDSLGMPEEQGKIAIFIVTKPSDDAFNFLANLMYSQMFSLLDYNANKFNGYLPTPVDIYFDEFKQLGEIPRFAENLAYVRSFNVGFAIFLQSLSQIKELYEKSWETILDCCDSILFLGSNSDSTLEYMENMLGSKTWYKKSTSRTFSKNGSNSKSYDIVGRKLAFKDEIGRMPKGKCIAKISNTEHNVFYSDIYDLKKHPRYKTLFEPRDPKTVNNLYDHRKYLEANHKKVIKKKKFEEMGINAEIVTIASNSIDPVDLAKFKVVGNQDTDLSNL